MSLLRALDAIVENSVVSGKPLVKEIRLTSEAFDALQAALVTLQHFPLTNDYQPSARFSFKGITILREHERASDKE